MKLYLVRHGETDWNRERRLQGQTDIPLNENGIRQAQETAEQLRDVTWDGMVYSSLARARQTAQIIAETLPQKGAWMRASDLLREQDYGSANGLPITFSDEQWETWYALRGVGGETDGQFEDRMRQAAEELLELGSGNLLVVTHGAVMEKLWEIFTGERFPVSSISNGQILCLEITPNKTGRFLYKDEKKMEMGYTTGSCAAAASKASLWMLLHQEELYHVGLMTPKGIPLLLELQRVWCGQGEASCAVSKNAGDDPDVTDGILIAASVSWTDETERKQAYVLPLDGDRILFLQGGEGIGQVTREGLADPVGFAAINPVPREMIRQGAIQVLRQWEERENIGNPDGKLNRNLLVTISAPEGKKRAEKTFNPHLGIMGGISILGTSGIVEPMSEQALVETIHLEMKQKVNQGLDVLLLVPGNYGEEFVKKRLGEAFPEAAYQGTACVVKCSNYIGETMDHAMRLGVRGILLVGHVGKLVKLAGGIMNTHSRVADARMEILAACALRAGVREGVAREILEEMTTEGGLRLCLEAGAGRAVMDGVAERCVHYLERRCRGKIKIGVVVFSEALSLVGTSGDIPWLFNQMKGRG